MSTKTLHHYTYRITNTKLNKHYYGIRSSKVLPILDLGVIYFSSSSDKEFIKDQKVNAQNYKYKIVKLFKTRVEAAELEIKLHNKFDVGINPYFYNRAKHTSTYFDVTGITHSEETKKKISESHKGKTVSEETRKKLSKTSKGRKHSEETKKQLSEDRLGHLHHNAKPANIYNHSTGELIASNVIIREWCRGTDYNRAHLSRSALTDRSKPSSSINNHHHKGIYARYI